MPRGKKKSESKNIVASKTMQGIAVAAAGVIAPYLMSKGIDATPETVAAGLVTLSGLAYAFYGRWKATGPLRLGRK